MSKWEQVLADQGRNETTLSVKMKGRVADFRETESLISETQNALASLSGAELVEAKKTLRELQNELEAEDVKLVNGLLSGARIQAGRLKKQGGGQPATPPVEGDPVTIPIPEPDTPPPAAATPVDAEPAAAEEKTEGGSVFGKVLVGLALGVIGLFIGRSIMNNNQ